MMSSVLERVTILTLLIASFEVHSKVSRLGLHADGLVQTISAEGCQQGGRRCLRGRDVARDAIIHVHELL